MKPPVLCLVLLSISVGIIRASPTPADEVSGTLDVSRRFIGNGQRPGLPDTSQTGEGVLPKFFFDRISNILGSIFGKRNDTSTAAVTCGGNTTDAKVSNKTAALLHQVQSVDMKMLRGATFTPMDVVQMMFQNIREKLRANGIPMLSDIILDVYGQACSEKNCADNAGICMTAILPPKNMSEYHQQCLPEMFKTIREEKNGTYDMAYCVMKAVFKDMNLTYSNDTKQNVLTYLQARVTDHPALKGAGKAVYESVENGICVPSTQANFEIRKEMKFHLCLVRKCVEEMAKET